MAILQYYGIKYEPTLNEHWSPRVVIAELPVMGVGETIEDAIHSCETALMCLLGDYKGKNNPYPETQIPDNLGVIYQIDTNTIQARLSPTRVISETTNRNYLVNLIEGFKKVLHMK